MVTVIRFKELNTLRKNTAKFNPKIERAMLEVGDLFSKAVQNSAKLRAPRRTGELAASINVRKLGKNRIMINVGAPYGRFQELGFEPHWVHALMPTRNNSGETIGDAFNIAGFAFVGKNTPFLFPAFEKQLAKLITLMGTRASKVIRDVWR